MNHPVLSTSLLVVAVFPPLLCCSGTFEDDHILDLLRFDYHAVPVCLLPVVPISVCSAESNSLGFLASRLLCCTFLERSFDLVIVLSRVCFIGIVFHLLLLLLLPRPHTPVLHLFFVPAWSFFCTTYDCTMLADIWEIKYDSSLSSVFASPLCRGGSLSDGWSAPTDPDPARGDGEHVAMMAALVLNSALLKPRCLEAKQIVGGFVLTSTSRDIFEH